MQISDPRRPWLFTSNRFLQRLYEIFLVATGRYSLHRAWQLGFDQGHRDEYNRIINNGGDLIPVLDAAIKTAWEDASAEQKIGDEKLRVLRAMAWTRFRQENSLFAKMTRTTREAVRAHLGMP